MKTYTSRLVAGGAVLAATAVSAFSGVATAAFPNFSDCPRASVTSCVNIQSRSGYLDIKGFRVPIGESFEIRGGIDANNPALPFVAPRGTTGVFAKPVQIPGGLLGLDLPISLNKVTATAQLAGSPSDIRIDLNTSSVSLPIKLKLTNALIGPGCTIGTNSSPVRLNLITGTTNPPAPNRPITGAPGALSFADGVLYFRNATNVDNAFSIPGASSCGLGIGLINSIVNAKIKLPSASGNNTMLIGNDVAITAAQ
jgi:hypothetical protein